MQRKVKIATVLPQTCPEIMIIAYKYVCEVCLNAVLIKREKSYYLERNEVAPRNRYHGLERSNHFIPISPRIYPPPNSSPN